MGLMGWSKRWLVLLVLVLSPAGTLSCLVAPEHESEVLVIRELFFVREVEGISDGFNLDDRISDEADAQGCGKVDLMGPNGEEGIDNSFSDSVLPALELTEGAALEPLIQNSINDGRLLLALELAGLVDAGSTSCREMRILRAMPPAQVGGDDLLLAGQTYDRDEEAPQTEVFCVEDLGDQVSGSGFELRLPLEIFDESIDMTLLGGVVELIRLEEGLYEGRFGGGVNIDEIKENVAALDGIGDEIPAIMDTVLGNNADLAPNSSGFCTQLSVTFGFRAATAFFYAD